MNLDQLIEQAEAARKVLGGNALVVLESEYRLEMEDVRDAYRADWPGCFVLSAKEGVQ